MISPFRVGGCISRPSLLDTQKSQLVVTSQHFLRVGLRHVRPAMDVDLRELALPRSTPLDQRAIAKVGGSLGQVSHLR